MDENFDTETMQSSSCSADVEEASRLPSPLDNLTSSCGPAVPGENTDTEPMEDEDDEEDEGLVEMVEQQEIATTDEAVAAIATFTNTEHVQFMQTLMESGQLDNGVIRSILAAFLAQRQPGDAEEIGQTVGNGAVTPEQAAAMRRAAREQAEEKVKEALESIDQAQQACGGEEPNLRQAKVKLQEQTEPLARGAADAQKLVHKCLQGALQDAEKPVKKADRDVRDVVVLRCRACCADPKDRDGFLVKASEAYNGELDKEVRAQLLLAYHKDPTNQRCGFISNNQIAADRRGGPRPRRRRQSPGEKKEAAEASSSHTQHRTEDRNGNNGQGSSCAAAAAEPMYVPQPAAEYQKNQEWPEHEQAYNQYHHGWQGHAAQYNNNYQQSSTWTDNRHEERRGRRGGVPGYSEGKWAKSVGGRAQSGQPVQSAWETHGSVHAQNFHDNYFSPAAPAVQEDRIGPAALHPENDEEATPGSKREAGRSQRRHMNRSAPAQHSYSDYSASNMSQAPNMKYMYTQPYTHGQGATDYGYMACYDMNSSYHGQSSATSSYYSGFPQEPSRPAASSSSASSSSKPGSKPTTHHVI